MQGRAAAAAATEAAEEQQSLDLADFILALSDRVKSFRKAESPAGMAAVPTVTCSHMPASSADEKTSLRCKEGAAVIDVTYVHTRNTATTCCQYCWAAA